MIRSGERAADLVAPPLFLHRFERKNEGDEIFSLLAMDKSWFSIARLLFQSFPQARSSR
jgi:hypothetical protein